MPEPSAAEQDELRYAACVIHYRATEMVVRSVTAMRAWTRPPDLVIVVDNSGEFSNTDTRAPLASDPVQWVAAPGNVGYGAAANIAAHVAREHGYERMLVVTQDANLSPDATDLLVRRLVNDPGIAIAAPLLSLVSNPDVVFSAGGDLTRRGEAPHRSAGELTQHIPLEGADEVAWADGACLLVNLNHARSVGDFPPEYFLYVEEIDFALSLRRRGYKVVVDRAARARQEPGNLTSYLLFRNSLHLTLKHRDELQPWPWLRRLVSVNRMRLSQGHLQRTLWALRGVWDAKHGRMHLPPASLFAR